MNKELSEDIVQNAVALFKQALELNNPECTVMLRFSGHVERFTVDVYCGGWTSNLDADISRDVYLDDDGALGKIEAIRTELAVVPGNNMAIAATRAAKIRLKEMAEYKRLKAIYGSDENEF